MATAPAPLNNPILGRMLQERQQQTQNPQPGPSSTPDAMGVPAQPEAPTIGKVEHTHDIAGLAPQPIAPQKALTKINPIQPSPAELSHQTEYNRLTGAGPNPNDRKPGWEQVHNPVGRTLGGIGNALSTLFPSISMVTPGTTLHHNMLVRNEKGALDQEQGARKEANTEQEQAAHATEQESLPEFHESQNEVKRLTSENRAQSEAGKTAETAAFHQGQLTAKEQAQEVADRKAGYRRNADGELEPIPYEEMTPQEQVNHDFKSSQRELNDATAALRKAQAEKNPEHESLAMQRLDIANRRLALSSRQFEMRAHGTEGGQPLPGSLLTDENKPVGTAFQQNVRPTGTERTRADLATSAHEQLADMRDVIKKHPEFFGPGPGRKTQFAAWIGSQDPDAQKFLTARSILADHAAGVFGARSEAAVNAQRIAAGELKDNPDAILSGLNQIEKAMGTIKSRGVVKTTGSNAAAESNAPIRARDPQGKLHEAPAGTPLPAGWKKE